MTNVMLLAAVIAITLHINGIEMEGMSSNSITYSIPSSKQDLPKIRQLLVDSELPSKDLNAKDDPEYFQNFLLAQVPTTSTIASDDAPPSSLIVGVIGLEVYPPFALLRSMAVAKSHRGQGISKGLADRIEAHALANGISEIYLLTTTAKDYFVKRGYSIIPRREAPEEIQSTSEFSGICPCSAVCLSKDLAASK